MLSELFTNLQRTLQQFIDEYPEVALSLYPPYLGAGVSVDFISEDFRRVDVSMPLRPYNQNYVGTQFGGSLYSMCDPFYMLILMRNLGDEYVVWDKAAEIRFRKPGTGTVHAHFELTEAEIVDVRRRADEQGVIEPEFDVEVVDDAGDVVAEVRKTLHVRRPGS